MVNYYFGSKEGLFEKLVIRKASFLQGKLQELLDEKTMEPIEKIDRIIENYVNRLFAHRGFSLTILREMTMQQRESMHEMIADVFSNNLKLIRQVLLQGIKKKQFKKVDLELTVATIIGTIHNLLVHETLVLRMLDETKDYKPFQNEKFKKRVIKHLQELMHAHLLIQ
jgi:AcrR family transcriptional regulator